MFRSPITYNAKPKKRRRILKSRGIRFSAARASLVEMARETTLTELYVMTNWPTSLPQLTRQARQRASGIGHRGPQKTPAWGSFDEGSLLYRAGCCRDAGFVAGRMVLGHRWASRLERGVRGGLQASWLRGRSSKAPPVLREKEAIAVARPSRLGAQREH